MSVRRTPLGIILLMLLSTTLTLLLPSPFQGDMTDGGENTLDASKERLSAAGGSTACTGNICS